MRRRILPMLFVISCFLSSTTLEAEDLVSKKEITLSPSNYAKEISTGLVIVDFWAPWCGPCRKMEPVLESLAEDINVKIGKLNIDTYQDFSLRQQNVRSIPTMKIYKDGKEVERLVGVFAKDELLKVLKPYLKK